MDQQPSLSPPGEPAAPDPGYQQPAPPVDGPAAEVVMPPTVRALRLLLLAQAVGYGVVALVGTLAYLLRDGDHAGLNTYGAQRTHPVALVVLGALAAAAFVLVARALPRRPYGIGRRAQLLLVLAVLDHIASFCGGAFNLWMVSGLLLAVASLWYLRTDSAEDYLLS
ncbi:hypothetical protein ACFQ1L_33455 [Phytohabitans flavus]|nr:hypothetical protein [Phytohabitans flavus]